MEEGKKKDNEEKKSSAWCPEDGVVLEWAGRAEGMPENEWELFPYESEE